MKECYNCGFNDEDYGCTCPHSDRWYACPIEAKKEENIQKLKQELCGDVVNCWIGKEVLFRIRADIQRLRDCSCSSSDGIIDDVEDIIDKYIEGSEVK